MPDETQEITPEQVETLPEVSIEDLRKQVAAKEEEIRKLQQTVSRHADSERKLKDQSETLTSLHKRLDQQEESQAVILDYLEEIRGEPREKTQTHKAELEERRKEKPKGDPDVARFVAFVESEGLSYDDSLVKEAASEDRNPKEALKYLRDKVRATQSQSIDKRAKEIAEGLLEQKLKELGLTAAGPKGPSGPKENWRDLSPEEKIRQAVSK